ncbi:MAG: hypothetical protein M3Y44_09175 [Actinomycetota bacterium]|nr:hypothetical protein [Actinomycetota bacterium]
MSNTREVATSSEVRRMHGVPQVSAAARVTIEGTTSRVAIEDGGASCGQAVVVNDSRFLQLTLEIARGHLPVTARRELVNAVFALPELAASRMVQAAIPIGDAELLAELRARLADVHTRAAGSTCLIDATTEL